MSLEEESLEEPFFEDKERGLKFIPNPRDPGAYHIMVKGKYHIYLHHGWEELAGHDVTTKRVGYAFQDASGGNAGYILRENGLDFRDLHLALLKLRIKEIERDDELLSRAYNEISGRVR